LICIEAIEAGQKHRVYGLLPQLIFNKACSLFYLGKRDEVKVLLRQAFYGAVGLGLSEQSNFMKNFALSELGIDIES